MPDIAYIVAYEGNTDPKDRSTQELVRASEIAIDGDYVVFTKADGTVAALFLRSTIRDWREATAEDLT